MNLHHNLDHLGSMGSRDYQPTDDVISQLVTKARRRRTVRQSASTAVAAVGAVALGMASMQAVAAWRDNEPAMTTLDLVLEEKFVDDIPHVVPEPNPEYIEYLQASAQHAEQDYKEYKAELEAKKKAEKKAQEKKEEEKRKKKEEEKRQAELEAKKKAEKKAQEKKDKEKQAKKDKDKKKNKKDKKKDSACPDWHVKLDGCHPATSGWTDTVTGKSFKAYKPDSHNKKIGIMTGPTSWVWVYQDSKEGSFDLAAKTCTGNAKTWIEDYGDYDKHYTQQYHCAKGKWVKSYEKVWKD